MKIHLNRALVVEGKEDASYLSNYISSEIIVVNGFEISKETILYLKNKPVILLLDPDDAGKTIRKKLNSALNNYIDIEIDIKKCKRGKKKGVAECEIDEILTKLSPFCSENSEKKPEITVLDLINLGLDNKELRNNVCKKLELGKCNNKQLLKRLVINNIGLDKLKETITEINDGNK